MLIMPHVHSQYSDGLITDGDLEKALGVPADEIVPIFMDHGMVYEAVRRHLGDFRRHPFIASEIYLRPRGGDRKHSHLSLIAYRPEGVRNLFRLIGNPPTLEELLSSDLSGLLVGSGCMSSPFYGGIREDPERIPLIREEIERTGAVFFVEAFPWDNRQFISAARKHARVLLSSDLHVLDDDFDAYQVMLLMRPDEGRRSSPLHPLKGGKGFAGKMAGARPYLTRLPAAGQLREMNGWLVEFCAFRERQTTSSRHWWSGCAARPPGNPPG